MSAIRYPTAAELEQGFAAYEAEMFARRTNPLPPAPRDQDDRPAPPPPADLVYCPECGKRFDFATKGMARMQLALHRKRTHPEIEVHEVPERT